MKKSIGIFMFCVLFLGFPSGISEGKATKGPLVENGILVLVSGEPGNQNVLDAVNYIENDLGYVNVEVVFGEPENGAKEAVITLEQKGVERIIIIASDGKLNSCSVINIVPVYISEPIDLTSTSWSLDKSMTIIQRLADGLLHFGVVNNNCS